MNAFFFDSSAIVKNYVAETGTAWVQTLIDTPTNRVYIARISGAEVVAAFVRRTRGNAISASDAGIAIRKFRYDFRSKFILVDVSHALIQLAMTLAETHGLRGYDAVQLAAATETNDFRLMRKLSALTLIAADAELLDAAKVEGVQTDDPNNH